MSTSSSPSRVLLVLMLLVPLAGNAQRGTEPDARTIDLGGGVSLRGALGSRGALGGTLSGSGSSSSSADGSLNLGIFIRANKILSGLFMVGVSTLGHFQLNGVEGATLGDWSPLTAHLRMRLGTGEPPGGFFLELSPGLTLLLASRKDTIGERTFVQPLGGFGLSLGGRWPHVEFGGGLNLAFGGKAFSHSFALWLSFYLPTLPASQGPANSDPAELPAPAPLPAPDRAPSVAPVPDLARAQEPPRAAVAVGAPERASAQAGLKQEAARQEAARQEAARQEAAKQEAAKQEAAKQEAAKQEAAKQEAAKQEAAKQEAAKQEAAKQEAARQATLPVPQLKDPSSIASLSELPMPILNPGEGESVPAEVAPVSPAGPVAILPASSLEEAKRDPRFVPAEAGAARIRVVQPLERFPYFGIPESGCGGGKSFLLGELTAPFDGQPEGRQVVFRLEAGGRVSVGQRLNFTGLRRAGKGPTGTFVYCGKGSAE